MRIYRRGSIYWYEFSLDNKHYQYSCKTKEKEIAWAIYADKIRGRFNIPIKNAGKYIFRDIFKEYIENQNVSIKTKENSSRATNSYLSDPSCTKFIMLFQA